MRITESQIRRIVRESMTDVSFREGEQSRLIKIINILLPALVEELKQNPAVQEYESKLDTEDEWSARESARSAIDTESRSYKGMMSVVLPTWNRWCNEIGIEAPISLFEKYMQNMILRAATGRGRDPASSIVAQLIDSFRYAAKFPERVR